VSPRDFFWRDDYPPSAPKLPPPEHGIKVTAFGSTWWGQRWIGALERFGGGYSSRLGRGRSYARQGRVHDLRVAGGAVFARVTGTRLDPYEVSLTVAPLDARAWERAIQAMAAKARFAAALLAGEMPKDIDEAFAEGGASLFPARGDDLVTDCSCPDWGNPCKHVAAVHYVLGEAFDRDPFLLFQLRGRDKATVLAALRRLRSASAEDATAPRRRARVKPAGTAPIKRLGPEAYEARADDAESLHFHIQGPAVPGAVLRQLGAPPSWRLEASPYELLHPAVARAAALARDLALGASGERAEDAREAPPKRRPPRS